jgi:hypothetical protein
MEKKNPKRIQSNCESCEFFDYSDEDGTCECQIALDEDEFFRFVSGQNRECPYYRYYDEYKSVRKQN